MDVGCWFTFNGALFLWRKVCLQLVGYCFCDLVLDSEHVRQIAIITLGPQILIAACINQLCVNTHTVTRALDASFYYMRDSELLTDLAQITRSSTLVMHYRRAPDHFQVRDPGQISQEVILDAISKIGVIWIGAEIFKRQHCNAICYRDLLTNKFILPNIPADDRY